MHRRRFLASSLATSALAFTGAAPSIAQKPSREYYILRRYLLQSGPQTKLTEAFFSTALIPALTRMGLGPVGAFRLEYGPETPVFYLLIPGASIETLATVDLHLAADADFVQSAASFWNAPAVSPSFIRIESTLLAAFEGWPRLTPPPAAENKSTRIFQLRTYESPSMQDHVRKVEMFHSGEFDIFRSAGFHQVFYGDTLVGTRMPSLTYMLAFDSMDELNADWNKFRDAPAWKKLTSSSRFSYEDIVSNISNLVLSPLTASQF